MASRYLNLPRIELTTLDGQLIALTERPPTESVLIIGPAVDGPNDRPIRVNSINAIEYLYGPVVYNGQYKGPNNEQSGFNGNYLIRALREVQQGGCADIRVLRVGGTTATISHSQNLPTSGGSGHTLKFDARFPGRIYNQVTVNLYPSSDGGGHRIEVSQPAVKGGAFTVTLAASGSVQDLIDALNTHPTNRSIIASQTSGTATTATSGLTSSTLTLTGGTDGTTFDDLSTNKTLLYTNITTTDGSFDVVEDYPVDNIYLAGIFLDDMVVSGSATTSIASSFANFLGKRTLEYPTLGFIGVRPLLDGSTKTKVNTHYTALTATTSGWRDSGQTWSKAGYFMNSGFSFQDGGAEQSIDTGAYLQVVAADGTFNDRDLGLYTGNLAGIYAGQVSASKPHMPTTHKPVRGIFGIPYEFSKTQLDYLTGGVGRDLNAGVEGAAAYVTVRRMEGQGVLWTKGVTAAQRRSDFKNLQPLRIANAVHKAVREICFPFLGQPNDIPHRKAIETSIKTFLDSLYDAGAILGRDGVGYMLEVKGGTSPISNLLGIIDINITLRPALEIQAVRVQVRMSL
jgi:hypothetical protein